LERGGPKERKREKASIKCGRQIERVFIAIAVQTRELNRGLGKHPEKKTKKKKGKFLKVMGVGH